MADWIGVSRSNYFHVKDEEAFLEFVEAADVDVSTDDQGRYSVAARYDGIWPTSARHETERAG